MCEEHHESGGAGCKLLTLQPNVGRGVWGFLVGWVFFKLQHAEATIKQTVLNRRLIYQALPDKICMHLIVLGQASVHNLDSG